MIAMPPPLVASGRFGRLPRVGSTYTRAAMPPAPLPPSSYASGGSPRQRVAAALLAIAANLLLVLMLLRLAGITPVPKDMSRITVFGIQKEQPSSEKKENKATKAERKQATTAAAPARAPKPAVRQNQSKTPFDWSELGIMNLSRRDYAASDVSKIAPHPANAAGAGEGQQADAGSGAGDSAKAGMGPNGEPLYAVEWYREPTDAELSTYVAGKTSPGAWAEIACRTVARFHVDDCIELADSPPGSRLAGAIRQAAFQFLVRPPRVGGKSLVGTWVRIRISFSEGARPR